MRRSLSGKVEGFRVRSGRLRTSGGMNGAFLLPARAVARTNTRDMMTVICSDGTDWDSDLLGSIRWEHVSASWPDRCPTWSEMCRVKAMFFEPHEIVMQYHPAESEYVNHHKYCLHLWRPVGVVFPSPPSQAVGPMS